MRPPSGVLITYGSSSPSPSTSPSIKKPRCVEVSSVQKRTCMCSPSTHAGAFRCKFHKKIQAEKKNTTDNKNQEDKVAAESSTRVSGEKVLVRRALRGSRRNKTPTTRREVFQPRPSRLSIMSKADDL
ncbi:hypothetical protein IFM89_016780 [Coptis chinensis]|uniref:Uncharacterized protein n=1 Tax=Coptis chinensis TaxID=261450 RepID=A0A835GUT8_9MAGN|nr:hypothetical protein IFM89_039931 [Coptis chinensis]KAF9586831.1 hypothetical protein IFM89_039932 [Coptis chinensis]KAF9586839.1 hypothetical protein IFM89_039940 [Coptis chinensis]KAF9586840.1 hypothetical protein IFM89_039941 [Coptis chinensis]KAF9588842.1 hypothetical protein IFM89_016780 [Coptis chinensis]